MNEIVKLPNDDTSLSPSIRDTLAEVLGDRTLNERFGGSDQRLSVAQCGLAAAVAAKLQDRLIEQIQQSHRREIGIIAGFWRLYSTPILQVAPTPTQATGESGQNSTPSRLSGLFSWGNILGGYALILIALAFYYTELTEVDPIGWTKKQVSLDGGAV